MLIRTSFTLPEEDVRLLDRLAALDDKNRSEMLRYLLEQMRPRMEQLVDILEMAKSNRDALLGEIGEATLAELDAIMPEVDRVDASVLGALSRLEGAMAAQAAEVEDPRRSNHGGQNLTPGKKDS